MESYHLRSSVGRAPELRGSGYNVEVRMASGTFRSTVGLVVALAAILATACEAGSALVEPADDGSAGESSTGGTGGTGGTSTAPPCDGPIVIDPTAIIDDMEDRDGSLNPTSGRNGSWWAAVDESPGGTFEPRMPAPEAILGGRCGSTYAMRVTGQGFYDWGALLGLNFRYAPDENGQYGAAPYDAHIRQGVRFWARVGDTSTHQIVFSVGDYHAVPEGGWCVENGTPACFTFEVTLSQIDTNWKQYMIPFAALIHATPDNPNEPLDPSRLWSLMFYFPASSVFDLWVDDLEFY
jgi:hypothetical protein